VWWVHAASLGETLAIVPLIQTALIAQPRLQIVLTCSSASALAVVPERIPQLLQPRVQFGFAPFDLPCQVDEFVREWDPKLAIWVESEFWPNMLHAARDNGTSTILLNGCISRRSYERWTRFKWAQDIITDLLCGFDEIVAKSEADAQRLSSLMARPVKLPVVDLKESAPPSPQGAIPSLLKDKRNRLWIAGSTHRGEERVLAKVHMALRNRIRNVITVIAPRHPERISEILSMCDSKFPTLKICKLSELDERMVEDSEDVIILVDSLGKLGSLYFSSDIAFVGASFAESELHGNHNVFEPRSSGCTLILRGAHSTDDSDPEFVETAYTEGQLVDKVACHLRRVDMSKSVKSWQDAPAIPSMVWKRCSPFLL